MHGKSKAILVLFGDCVIFAGSLALTLLIRYGTEAFFGALAVHRFPFSILLIVWIVVFYIADLYTYTNWRTTIESLRVFLVALGINILLSIGMFYMFGSFFKLTPKLNLILFSILFGILDGSWRFGISRVLSSKEHTRAVIMLAATPLAASVINCTKKYPSLGYHIDLCRTEDAAKLVLETYGEKATIVVDSSFLKDPSISRMLYERLSDHIRIETFADFYAKIFGRVPLSEIEESWFIREISPEKSSYDFVKHLFDLCLAVFSIALFSPIFLVLYALIPIDSRGSPIYSQTRIGQDGAQFTLYKFRSMTSDAEKNGPVWWKKNDSRATKIGTFLRRTHLDELPQLFNILNNDMSFVGPRPERPEFVDTLAAEIPHYMIRHTIKPGLTGWAQIKFRYASTLIDSREKFEYDLYYIQHRNFLIDAGVIVKTVQFVFGKC